MLQDTSDETELEGSPPETPGRARRTTFGNRRDLVEVYERANQLIIDHGLLRLKRFEEVDGVKRLTICNLWRLERAADGTLRAFAFDLAGGEWREEPGAGNGKLEHWPELRFCPVRTSGPPTYWRYMFRKVIWHALDVAGYKDLPDNGSEITSEQWEEYFKTWADRGYFYNASKKRWQLQGGAAPAEGGPTPPARGMGHPDGGALAMRKSQMANILHRRILGREKFKDGKRFWTGGILDGAKLNKAAIGLRACLWEHFVDREVASALMVMNWRDVPFPTYVNWMLQHREHLLRVARERRNLLPLLRWIHPDQYGRPDLFSRKLWVKSGRTRTMVDRKGFSLSPGAWRVRSFESKAAWKALSAAPASVVREWGYRGLLNPSHWANIAAAQSNVPARLPVVAIVELVRHNPDSRGGRHRPTYGVSPVLQHLYRLFLLQAAHVWKTEGFKAVKAWLRVNGFRLMDVLDFLEAEGFAQGALDRNTTWSALERRSHDWHERVRLDRMEREHPLLTWTSALPEMEIDDVQFRPLITSVELAREGYDLHHCIGSYASYCASGRYRAFAVSDTDGARSTLGLRVIGKKKRCRVEVEQHRGKYNDEAGPAAAAAGRKLAVMYQAAVRAGLAEHVA